MNKTKLTLTIGLNYANIALQSIYKYKCSSSVQLYINFDKNNNVKPKNISTK